MIVSMSSLKDEEFSPSLSGSVTILDREAVANENEASETIATNSSSEMSADAILLQTQDRTSSPSILIQSEQNHGDVHIAFSTIYHDRDEKQTFLPNTSMIARVVEVERSSVFNHPFNPNLYVIELQHGEFSWRIKKRYHHFQKLDADLLFHRAKKAGVRPSNDPGRLHFAPAILLQNREERQNAIETYIQDILDNRGYHKSRRLQEFFEISRMSFVKELGVKRREGVLLKRSGGHVSPHLAKCCCCFSCFQQCCCYVWKKRWFVVKDSFIAYLDPSNQEVKGVLLMDETFSVKISPGLSRGLLIKNRDRELTVFCWTHRRQSEWMAEIVRTMADTGSQWTKENAYGSYAPPRQNVAAQWFVDGEDYFYAVSQALDEAKEEIFITDWWFSPELHMVRPSTENDYWRLDRILQRKAKSGVMIYVLLYKEMEMALTIKSIYSKTALMKLHPTNIKVLRHPDHTPGKTGIFYWAHHEKIVCIDQKVVFLGGLDLCYGRWDNCKHYLTDCDTDFVSSKSSRMEKEIANIGKMFLGAFSNGIPNFNQMQEKTEARNLKRSRSRKLLKRARLWRGKDYSNPIKKDFVDLHKPEQDIIDRSCTNRMPWHDVAVCLWGQVARDVARHFIQRWNFTKLEKKKTSSFFPLLLPKTYTELVDGAPDGLKISNVNCQILRSVGKWSAGCPLESSIYNAYIHLIKTSKHYIYIENQFFITSLLPDVKNAIGDLLVERIMRAHNNGENFKLFIVMPLLPAFEGEIGNASGTSICVITHWNYMSLCRGHTSLIERLKQNGVEEPFKYVSICSLRKHEEFSGTLITELIYVHSKVMIVDDCYAIIGSANINDRSLLGKRDSEIAILAEDCEFIDSRMDGKEYKSGVFSSGLRRRLMKEHLGLLESEHTAQESLVDDPISESFFKDVWSSIAETNTGVYEKVFHCLPSDSVQCFDDLPQYKNLQGLATTDPQEARKELENIQGHLVNMPLKFLQNSDLRPPSGSKEALVPVKVFT